MRFLSAKDIHSGFVGLAGILAIAGLLFAGVLSADEHEVDMEAAGGDVVEPCEEGADAGANCQPQAEGVQSRGTLVGPLSFKLKSSRYNTCLRPTSTSKGAVVRLYNCGNYTSRYWTAVDGQRFSPLRGEWNADWQYKLKNNWTGLCLKVDARSTTGNQRLIQTDCSSADLINFMPSPNMFAGEYVVIRGSSGGARGSAGRQYCIRAVARDNPVVNSSANTTHECAYWNSLLWSRAAW